MNVSEEIKKIIEGIIEKEYENIFEMNFFENLEFDSISIMTLIDEIEEKYSIYISEDRLIEAISSVDNLVKVVNECLNEKNE